MTERRGWSWRRVIFGNRLCGHEGRQFECCPVADSGRDITLVRDPRKDASKDAASETEAEEKLDKALRELGLTTPQYATLSALEESPGLWGAALARHSFVTPQTMNGIVTNLETTGLVVRRSHPKHGRVLQAYLTEEGVGQVVRAHWVEEAIEERILSDPGKEERRWLLDGLRSFTGS